MHEHYYTILCLIKLIYAKFENIPLTLNEFQALNYIKTTTNLVMFTPLSQSVVQTKLKCGQLVEKSLVNDWFRHKIFLWWNNTGTL